MRCAVGAAAERPWNRSCHLQTASLQRSLHQRKDGVMIKGRQGFTLIELLIVVVIIGILAAIAIPKFSKTRERAYFSAMKSDLKNLAAEQEIYYSDPNNNYSYANSTTDLNFSPSSGVSISMSATPTGAGWS